MEKSASAPVLEQEDYRVPYDGIGLTGHPKRILAGPMSKDKGTYSSRINQIIRQAEKVPGPGMYVKHEEWIEGKTNHVIHAGNKYSKSSRDYKPMNKTPGPIYESKDFGTNVPVACKDSLSNNPRVTYGAVPKGKKRSFLDQAIAQGGKVPAAGPNDFKMNNKLPTAVTKVLSWKLECKSSSSKKPAEKEIGPDHYSINYASSDFAVHKGITVPKAKAQNFLEKAVSEKWVDVKSKREIPGPGTYSTQTYDDSKFTRGTKALQLRGLSRSSVSGYF